MLRFIFVLAIVYILGIVISYVFFALYNNSTNRHGFSGTPSQISKQNSKRAIKDALLWPKTLVWIALDSFSRYMAKRADNTGTDSFLVKILNEFGDDSPEFKTTSRYLSYGYDRVFQELYKVNPDWRSRVEL